MSESIRLSPAQQWRFSLVIDPEITELGVRLADALLEVKVPPAIAGQWINSQDVSIETHLEVAPGERLHLLIEKDFPCISRPGEDPSDYFEELADSDESC